MSSSAARSGVGANHVEMSGGLQQGELEPEEFDALLHSNVLDTLADFDFPYADLSGGVGLDSAQQQQQQQPPTSPKPLSGRKRSFTQACTWDNLGPKALSEISASLLAAGGGGWEGMQAPPPLPGAAVGVDSHAPSCASVPLAVAAAAGAAPKQEAGHRYSRRGTTATGGACGKGRRASGAGAGLGGEGVGKRPLNPERMERKANREKRRREEVNEQFEQLLEVLEDAEATSGLEPPAAKEGGKAGPACINGRRVEVLSRTINVLKQLLQARRDSLAAAAAAAVAGVGAAREDEGAPTVPHGLGSAAVDKEGTSAAAAAAAPAVSDFPGVESASTSLAANAAEAPDEQEAHAAAAAAEASNPQPVVHHMAMAMPGHHAPLMMQPNFAGMPGAHGMPGGRQGQPIYIAVPMFMGQGMPPSSSAVESGAAAAQAPPAAAAVVAPSMPAAAAMPAALPPVPAAHPAPSPTPAPTTAVAETKVELGMNPPSKAWAMPAGMDFQPMTLDMPPFVAHALSAEEGDENPTHAVCA